MIKSGDSWAVFATAYTAAQSAFCCARVFLCVTNLKNIKFHCGTCTACDNVLVVWYSLDQRWLNKHSWREAIGHLSDSLKQTINKKFVKHKIGGFKPLKIPQNCITRRVERILSDNYFPAMKHHRFHNRYLSSWDLF